MAIKTFTTGEVLTASDTNTYLANSGLVFIKSVALATATTNITSCFSSTYRNYRVIIDDVTPSASISLYIRFLTGTTPDTSTNYGWAYTGILENNTVINNASSGQNLAFTGINISFTGASLAGGSLDMYNPQAAKQTIGNVIADTYESSNFGFRTGSFRLNTTNQYDGFQITTGGAPTVTGNVTVYGYRLP